MPRIYSQCRNDSTIFVISLDAPLDACRREIARHAAAWLSSKPGRKAKSMGTHEIGFLFSDGKMAASMWIEEVPVPMHESPFTPAKGAIPGLTVQP